MAERPPRTLVAWCPDWPVVSAGYPPSTPVAVVVANRVVATSGAARNEGVRSGLRRREAQGRCPTLEVIDADPAGEVRAWERIVAAVELLTTRVEVLRPGVVALATRGPSRYFGGDEALAARVAATVDGVALEGDGPRPGCRVGVADGRFAAELAARSVSSELAARSVSSELAARSVSSELAARSAGPAPGAAVVVAPGQGRAWLSGFPVMTLGRPELTDVLVRLGIRTLGDLATLPAPSVLARFGPDGLAAHRLASGLDERPLAARVSPPDLTVAAELDPPADRVDTAAFVAKALADELHVRLAESGLACTRIAIEAETEHGEHLSRLWRHDGALSAGAVAERVRWQLDGWLAATGGLSGGLTLVRLVPDEVRPDHGRQLGFWGGAAEADERVARALARVQGLLGPDAVVTAVVGGGRSPAEQVHLVPWGEPRRRATVGSRRRIKRTMGAAAGEVPPWPGQLPGPAPALIHQPPLPAEVVDHAGVVVGVSGRGQLSAPPARVAVAGGSSQDILAWAGPWPIEERWWDPEGRRQARFQVVLADREAHLMAREGNQWWVVASYD